MSQEKKSSAMEQRVEDLLGQLTLKEKVSQMERLPQPSFLVLQELRRLSCVN